MGTDAITRWLAAYLSWLVWALLVLWMPPAALTVAVNLGLITDAGSGFARLTDIPFALTLLQLVLMAGSLPGLLERRLWAWRAHAAAASAWALHAAWQIQSGLRLTGIRTLVAPETLLAVAMLVIYWLILVAVRRHFDEPAGGVGIAANSPGRVP